MGGTSSSKHAMNTFSMNYGVMKSKPSHLDSCLVYISLPRPHTPHLHYILHSTSHKPRPAHHPVE